MYVRLGLFANYWLNRSDCHSNTCRWDFLTNLSSWDWSVNDADFCNEGGHGPTRYGLFKIMQKQHKTLSPYLDFIDILRGLGFTSGLSTGCVNKQPRPISSDAMQELVTTWACMTAANRSGCLRFLKASNRHQVKHKPTRTPEKAVCHHSRWLCASATCIATT